MGEGTGVRGSAAEPPLTLPRPIEPVPTVHPRAPEPPLPSLVTTPQLPVQEEPRIEVRIGRVEIKTAAPPPRPAAKAPKSAKGFAEYAAARTWRDRKW